jgi:hypothetical protein
VSPTPGSRPVVENERVLCPDCGGRIVGMVDVTVHPTLRFRGGRASVGPLVDSMRAIREQAAQDGATVFHDEEELYCEHVCGYYVRGGELRRMLESTDAE